MHFQDLKISLEEMSSKGEGCLEKHTTHPTHVEWVREARTVLDIRMFVSSLCDIFALQQTV